MQIVVTDAELSFGDRTVLEGLSAVFHAEAVTALLGPSGSGKSTLLAAMAGYQKLNSGSIVYVDSDGSPLSPDPELVAWVPQGSNALGTRSTLDNVMIAPLSEGLDAVSAQTVAEQALKAVGLLSHASQPAKLLSGGELQRVSFARALATSKPFIFADEPSASLDAVNTEILAGLLADLRSRATIIVATHDPILVSAAGDVVSIRSGRRDAA